MFYFEIDLWGEKKKKGKKWIFESFGDCKYRRNTQNTLWNIMYDKFLSHAIPIIGDCLVTRLKNNCTTCRLWNNYRPIWRLINWTTFGRPRLTMKKIALKKRCRFLTTVNSFFSNKTHPPHYLPPSLSKTPPPYCSWLLACLNPHLKLWIIYRKFNGNQINAYPYGKGKFFLTLTYLTLF